VLQAATAGSGQVGFAAGGGYSCRCRHRCKQGQAGQRVHGRLELESRHVLAHPLQHPTRLRRVSVRVTLQTAQSCMQVLQAELRKPPSGSTRQSPRCRNLLITRPARSPFRVLQQTRETLIFRGSTTCASGDFYRYDPQLPPSLDATTREALSPSAR